MPSSALLARLCRVRDLIRECHAEPINLLDCATEVDLSPWHLLRAFRDAFCETPHAFLTRVRVEQARQLLVLTERSVTEVCFGIGFSLLGSFSTLFKRHVGWSPAAYRRRVHGWISVPAEAAWVFVPCCFAFRYGGPTPPIAISEKQSLPLRG